MATAKSKSGNKTSKAKSAPKGRRKIISNAHARRPDASYIFNVVCSFEVQYTFIQSEVELDPGGDGENDSNWEHVTHCSPCHQEFLDVREALREELRERNS